jgi:hypothetical protein
MIEKFLKAKHWQLFVLMFGVPMIFQFIMMGTIFASISSGAEPDPSTFINIFSIFPLMMILFMGIFFGWFWSIAIGLQEKIPANVKMKTGKFKVFFFIPLIYISLFTIGISTTMSGLLRTAEAGEQPNIGLLAGSMAIIFPLHILSMFSIFYCLYFVSKTFKTVELQRETTFSDFAGEFFLLWFYPVGIWIIQPKINKMIEGNANLEGSPG